jgi:hypothetical protein
MSEGSAPKIAPFDDFTTFLYDLMIIICTH